MKGLTISKRTTKSEGEIKLRFRLRDGGSVDLYHKSEIRADLKDLDKFDDSGNVKPRVSIYNKRLKLDIDMEIDAIETAYRNLCSEKDKSLITAQEFEAAIDAVLNPHKDVGKLKEKAILERFDKYIEDGMRDGDFGPGRKKHYDVALKELTRYLTIRHMVKMLPSEFDSDNLMDYRQFLFDEYLYVDRYKSLYELMAVNNRPSARRDQNTVAEKMKVLQAFFNDLVERGELATTPFAHLGKGKKRTIIRESYNQPVFLLQDELLKVMSTEVPVKLQETKDAFLLQCAFGCRISDYKNLTMENVSVCTDGTPYIHYLPEKTKRANTDRREIETPIMLYALDIIRKYRFKFAILKYVDGKSGYNVKIRELLKFCEIDRKCPVYDDELETNTYKPIYEIASNKLCRKTHVDILTKAQINMYAAGLHEEGSDAVNHYTYMNISDRFKLMCYAYRQPAYKVDKELNVIE